LHGEEAVTIDGHVGGDRRRRDRALAGNGLLGKCGDATCDLLVRHGGVWDQILEGGVDPLVAGSRGVRDIAGNVLQREGLRLDAAYRGVQRVEDTHNNCLHNRSSGKDGRNRRRPRKRYANMENQEKSM